MYYRSSKRVPYLHQQFATNNEEEAEVPSSNTRRFNGRGRSSSSATLVVTNTTTTTTTNNSPRKVSFGGEADAAAGTFQQRVSSFGNLLLLTNATTTSATTGTPAPHSPPHLSEHHHHHHRTRTNPMAGSIRRGAAPESAAAIATPIVPDWRLRDRMKTVGVGLILAVNVGTDPPDVVKPHPCAVLQCWIDPTQQQYHHSSRDQVQELIGERLEAQYAKWQLARKAGGLVYRRAMDPTVDDVRQLCLRLRSQARTDRVLLHYNGHGVPRPSDHGEIWVFDKNHTEYIPLSVADLKSWIGKPAIVVLDCSGAGILVPFFTAPPQPSDDASTAGNSVASSANSHTNINLRAHSSTTTTMPLPSNNPPISGVESAQSMDELSSQWVRDTIVLCPCSENEWLPMHPDYPADIFTSCLTTPMPMALRWFVNNNPASMSGLNPEAVDAIPGMANDRKTPLGELNWIFTTVTDSIAWNILPKPLFARLFRQDLLVASMFRNFLLADRILRSLGCTPVSFPPLPAGAADHPLWQAWDLACETLLFQLMKDGILGNHVLLPAKSQKRRNSEDSSVEESSVISEEPTQRHQPQLQPQTEQSIAVASSISSPFFSEQLAAFEVWLEFAEIHKIRLAVGGPESLDPPEHLPVVLQVLLSQVHRIRALTLLKRFLVLGPWAVNLSLRLGIFPYVMKLLQSPEYKSLLVAIWASILAFDPSCRVDVLKDGALHHFVQHLLWGLNSVTTADMISAAKERTLAAFVLAACCYGYPAGQAECVRLNLHSSCCALLSSYEQGEKAEDDTVDMHMPAHLRLWLCICLANMAKDNVSVQNELYASAVHEQLKSRLTDKNAEVRAAVCYAVGCMIGESPKNTRLPSVQDLSSQLSQQGYVGLQPNPVGTLPSRFGAPVQTLQSDRATFTTAGLPDHMRSQTTDQPLHVLSSQQQAHQTRGFRHPARNLNPERQSIHSQIFASGLAPRSQHLLSSPVGLSLESGHLISSQNEPLIVSLPLHQTPQFINVDTRAIMKQPTVFEDRRRLELDLSLVELMLKAVRDGSVVVRYEATIALGGVVCKYLDAFVCVAEDFSSKTASMVSDRVSNLESPRGLKPEDLESFRPAWMWLRSLQREDPFPPISKAANAIVSVVHETLLRNKTEDLRTGGGRPSAAELGGIDEDQASSLRVDNVLSQPLYNKNLNYGATPESGNKSKRSDLRRVSSEMAYSHGRSVSMEENAETRETGNLKDGEVINYSFPKSQFHEFKKSSFDPNFKILDEDFNDLDPLSPSSATEQYQYRRNYLVREQADKLAQHFASLAPKPPKPVEKSIQMILEEEEEDATTVQAAEEEASAKKMQLELKEARLCKNDGVKMTSLVEFHPFENYLVACGDTSSVTLWSTQTGKRYKSFLNGNPKGSRMTSSCWINADTASHFLVGCDDGSVRVWGDMLDSGGESGLIPPSLLAAFHAAPMESDPWGSGLVCEWQPYSGMLVVGGNSKFIRCWDLEAESAFIKMETGSDSYVTTLTTAWDSDMTGDASGAQKYQAIGKHLVVAGHSDGSIRLFDIRTNAVGNQNHSVSSYCEHKSWVVSTSLTSYGGRYELISGTLSGEIKAWDLRMSASVRTLDVQRSTMTTLAVHRKIPIVATGSEAQFIKIVALDGETMQLLRYHEKMASHRIGPVSCLAFHPYKPLLAAGATDSYIGIYATKKPIQVR